jgi:hypothetical protein
MVARVAYTSKFVFTFMKLFFIIMPVKHKYLALFSDFSTKSQQARFADLLKLEVKSMVRNVYM